MRTDLSLSTHPRPALSDCGVSAFFQPQVSSFFQANDRARTEPVSPPLHRLETALVSVTAAHLCFLPWALGSMHRWSQLVSLVFALAGFALSLWPQIGSESKFSSTGRLWRFPVFWAGLALLLYVVVQGLNPSWSYRQNTDSWWLEPVPHLAWLPSGVQAPFARSSPWSALVIFASLWLLVCSVWIGFTRRRSYRLLFTVLVGNAFLLALLGVLQQLTDAKEIFWSYLPSNGSFIASFIYRNHAGPYLNLMVSLAAGLSFWHYQRAQRRHEQPGLAAVLAFLAVFVAIMVVFSYSRASIGVLLGFTFFILCSLVVRRYFVSSGKARSRKDLLLLVLVLGGLLSICVVSIRAEKVWQRFTQLSTEPASSIGIRSVARQASGDMLSDRWLFGWGAGCFRYGFPLYAQKYPSIYLSKSTNHLYWEHAHDDLLEFPIELGAVGLLPLVAILGYTVWQLVRLCFWRNNVAFFLVLACLLVACHAWVDFVFQNPAVLLTWSVLLVAAVRWIELDHPGSLRPVTRLPRPGRMSLVP